MFPPWQRYSDIRAPDSAHSAHIKPTTEAYLQRNRLRMQLSSTVVIAHEQPLCNKKEITNIEDVFFLTEALQISNTIVKICTFYYTAEVHRECECVRVHARHKSVGIELQSKQRLTIGSVY